MKFLKCEVFIPDKDKLKLIDALSAGGFLSYGGYGEVYSESPVLGHFTPLAGSNPSLGTIGSHEIVNEVKVEFRIKKEDKDKVYEIIKKAHPYEVPVINFIDLV
mgnify:CR=1 FL=1